MQATEDVVQHAPDWQWPVVQSAAAAHAPPMSRGASHVDVTARHTRYGAPDASQHADDAPHAAPWLVQHVPNVPEPARQVPLAQSLPSMQDAPSATVPDGRWHAPLRHSRPAQQPSAPVHASPTAPHAQWFVASQWRSGVALAQQSAVARQ